MNAFSYTRADGVDGAVQAVLPSFALMQKKSLPALRPKSSPFLSTGVLNITEFSVFFQSSLAAMPSPFFSSFTAVTPRPEPV